MDSRSLSITISLSRCAVAGLRTARPMSQDFFCFVKRTGDDVNADEFSNAAGCDGTRFSRGFHGTRIAANQDDDVAVSEVFLANEDDVGGLHHGIGRLNGSDETACLDHP